MRKPAQKWRGRWSAYDGSTLGSFTLERAEIIEHGTRGSPQNCPHVL